MTPHGLAIGDEQRQVHSDGQDWLISWHGRDAPPAGKNHGSAGICVTPDGGVVLVTEDRRRWAPPGGRPEGDEDWEATLRREVDEEACVTIADVRLLGFARGECTAGHELGLVLVRSLWLVQVELREWVPRFEIIERRVLTPSEVASHPGLSETVAPILARGLVEAGLA